jgi:hypothetical protein
MSFKGFQKSVVRVSKNPTTACYESRFRNPSSFALHCTALHSSLGLGDKQKDFKSASRCPGLASPFNQI